jgi:starch synthase (maltosyl-transferring)
MTAWPGTLRLMKVTIATEPIVIGGVVPELGCGRYAVKREAGDWLLVWADIFRDGHDLLTAVLRYRAPNDREWRERQLALQGNDRWHGSFPLDRIGEWSYSIEAWTDRWGSWLADTRKKRDASARIDLELVEGRRLIEATVERARGNDRAMLERALEEMGRSSNGEVFLRVLLDDRLSAAMRANADRSRAVRYKELKVIVDRERARFAAWYEFFPRSAGGQPGVYGTFADAARRIPDIASLGFDVVYLPPIHPIGYAFRKGPNNATQSKPDDVGSPWAIGSAEGGHTAVHPQLGTLDDFRRFVRTVRDHGMEVALDYALQSSPDHPWIKEHPEWFSFRPDGSIRYAENPPKKYQDIVNFNFESPDAPSLWNALRDIFFFWIDQGVKTFRVDNPHTKPVPFWEWVIARVRERNPEVIFLSEAFTRPHMMQQLAKVGFTQSYTYFTWRNTKTELTEYMIELATETNEYLRPNFFTNTPDILHKFLQDGGRPAFRIRLALAATLSSLYGIYSGFELCENKPVRADSEEYLDSEKYEIRVRDWNAPGNIRDDVRAINRLRRENRALHEFENIRFYPSNDDAVIFYGKTDFLHRNFVFVAVNLDPRTPHSPVLEFPTGEFGLSPAEIKDELNGTPLTWSYGRAYTELHPERNPAAIFVVNR